MFRKRSVKRLAIALLLVSIVLLALMAAAAAPTDRHQQRKLPLRRHRNSSPTRSGIRPGGRCREWW